jgi:hypothetical protein
MRAISEAGTAKQQAKRYGVWARRR